MGVFFFGKLRPYEDDVIPDDAKELMDSLQGDYYVPDLKEISYSDSILKKEYRLSIRQDTLQFTLKCTYEDYKNPTPALAEATYNVPLRLIAGHEKGRVFYSFKLNEDEIMRAEFPRGVEPRIESCIWEINGREGDLELEKIGKLFVDGKWRYAITLKNERSYETFVKIE